MKLNKGILLGGLFLALLASGAVYFLNFNNQEPAVRNISSNKSERCVSVIDERKLLSGDIIFQESKSRQSKTIQKVTGSRWSHMGIVVYRKSSWQVLEAVQPVKITPLQNWIKRGKNCDFVVKRLKENLFKTEAELREEIMAKFKKYKGKSYDLLFQPGDDKIYCSELVEKIYARMGVSLGEWVPIGSLDLSSPEFEKLKNTRFKKIAKRQSKGIDEVFEQDYKSKLIVTPISIFKDKQLACIMGCSF